MMNVFGRSSLPLLIWLLLAGATGSAQGVSDAQKRYKAAIQLVKSGDYERAKTDLNVLIQRDGPLAPYASYYYALAAYRQKKFEPARLMLKQLMTRYPDWRQLDEAEYLLAAVYMETGQYEDGLIMLQRIGDPALRADVNRQEQYFLTRLTDLDRLKQIAREFPENRAVGLALIDLIQRTSSDKDDLELSDRLTNRFGVPSSPTGGAMTTRPQSASSVTASPTTLTATSTRPAPAPSAARSARPKGYYNVAVMFPFKLDDFNAEKRLRSNQYVYDLYNGIKMAKAKLQEEGITINLFAYDADSDANKALELINSPAFTQTDLIIGPLYVEPNRIASAFANQNNVLLLNPIATSSELVTNQPMSFLAQPSLNQQAQRTVDQLRPVISSGNRRAAIYFGAARKDSLLALAYQNELKRLNMQVVDFRRMGATAQATADAMKLPVSSTAPTARPGSAVQPNGLVASGAAATVLGHVFLASSNDTDGPRLLEALSRRRVSGPLIATSAAFDYYKNPVSTFTRRDLYLLYPDFVDKERPAVADFQEQYLSQRNTIPSVFAYQGYDMMLFFGRQLAKNSALQRNRAGFRSDTDDYVLSGFDYTTSNENQIVPIVKYEDGRFVKIN